MTNEVTIKNIIRTGLAKTGNGFKTTVKELENESGLSSVDVCIALNTITQWNAWEMITE